MIILSSIIDVIRLVLNGAWLVVFSYLVYLLSSNMDQLLNGLESVKTIKDEMKRAADNCGALNAQSEEEASLTT